MSSDGDASTTISAKLGEAVNGAVNGANSALDSAKSLAAANTDLYTVPAQINGKEVHLESTFDVISPSTGKLIHRCSAATPQDAIRAVEAAQAAFPAWRDYLPAERRDIFLRAAAIAKRRAAEFGGYMQEETGSGQWFAETFNVGLAADILTDVAGRIATLEGSVATTGFKGTSALILREPFGVILAIAPWNAAYILGFRSVAYALAAGNTAILKASEASPRCSWAIADTFREAGLPAGVLNVIAHRTSDAPLITRTLIEHPSIKKVNFTGSTAVGRIIGELCGRNLKPVLLELGGKAPAIVWEDADLELAAAECAKGAFVHAGQVCMSTERIIVHRNVVEGFEKAFVKATGEMFGQKGHDVQALINRAAVEKNKRLVNDATSKGASILNSSSIDSDPPVTETRLSPLIVKNVTPEMDIYHTESFGPTVSIILIDSEEEALRIANDTEYGLSAAVFTEDLRRGLRFAKNIESGAVHVNGMSVHDESMLPHGGVKSSGFGRFGSVGLGEWVRTKTVTFKD